MRGDFFDSAMQYRDLDLAAQRRAEEEIVESKHTPGPWNRTPTQGGEPGLIIESIDSPDGHIVATALRSLQTGVAAVGTDWRTKEEAEANARLIAAAPDLLLALKAVLGWGLADPSQMQADAGHPGDIERQARAAIARAEGR